MEHIGTDPGPGWWQASDLRWYPPELHPDRRAALPPPPSPDFVPATAYPLPPAAHHPATIAYSPASSSGSATRTTPISQPAARTGDAGRIILYLLVAAVCTIYVLSPLDLMPEVVLGPLGLPDDIIAAVVALSTVVAALRARPDRDT